MNYKKVFKRETKVIAYVVIALTLVVIGTSYALFLQVNNNQDNQVVTAGSLVIEYAKGNTVTVDENAENNCLKPQSDTTGSSTGGCNFTLSITNKGTLPMQYDLLIYNNTTDVDIPSDAQFVDHSLVRHSLNKQYSKEGASSEIVTAGKALSELETKEDKRVLESSMIAVGETITFSLNIWINEDATVDIIGQYVYLKLDVVGSVYESNNLSDYIINKSATDTSLEKFEHEATEQTIALTDYRYVGSNPNNYVYFGCEDNCTEDNLYRIIGVMPTQSEIGGDYENRVKLIKADFYMEEESGLAHLQRCDPPTDNAYGISESEYDDWQQSTLNLEVLNGVYWNSLGSKYQNFIASSVWYLGMNESYTIDNIYKYERSNTSSINETPVNTKQYIGLMYASDYGYSGGESYRLQNASQLTKTWLFVIENNFYEWTLTFWKDGIRNNILHQDGLGIHSRACSDKIRPTFYLKSNVLYESGNGSQEEPYRITL